jgi:hypothetical protein
MGVTWRIHLPVFFGPGELARILWFDFLVRKVIEIPGIVVEFGSQYGASFSTLHNLFQIHDAWNISRRLVSFSTFDEGFVDVKNKQDGSLAAAGDYATIPGWKSNLENILGINSMNSPVNKKNFEIHEGDASLTFQEFLNNNPSTIISFAHFDMDIYSPTKNVLELCLTKMTKGSIIVFDELNHPAFPGETKAVEEVLGIRNIALRKTTFQPYSAYAIV